MAVLTQDRLATLQSDFEKAIIDIGFKGTPAFNRFKEMAKNISSKKIWARRVLTAMEDQLNGAISSTTTTSFTVDGSTAANPLRIWPGNMIALLDTEWVSIDAQPTSTTWTVTRGAFGSTAATHADNTRIYVMPMNPIGSPKLGKDDSQLAARENNLLQNYQKELPVANPIRDGSMPNWAGENEGTLEHQKKLWNYEARKQAETSFFYGRRSNQGTAATSTSGVTLTSDSGNNMTGGLHFFNGQHSGRSTTYTTYSMENLQTGTRVLAQNGAFGGIEDTEYGDADCIYFVSRVGFDKLNQLRWPLEHYNDGKGEQIGSTTRKIIVSGITCAIEASDCVQNGHSFLISNRKDLYKILLKRWGEEQSPNYDGDQTIYTCTYSWMNMMGDCLITEFASGYPTS